MTIKALPGVATAWLLFIGVGCAPPSRTIQYSGDEWTTIRDASDLVAASTSAT